jgi:hypothetical protein
VDSLFDRLAGAKVFSTFDALWGFWQLMMHPDDVEKTSMVTPFGSFQWRVLVMGLRNSPSTFQRILQGYLECRLPDGTSLSDFVTVFIDDVLCFSKSIEEHKVHLEILLNRLREVNIIMKGSKAQLFRKKVKFLGHILSGEGISPQHSKCEAVKQWPVPKTVQHVRQFLGLVGFYKRYIPHYAHIARPMFDLLKGDIANEDFQTRWTKDCQDAFEELKTALTTKPCLILPNQEAANSGESPFLVVTDVSGVAIGGVLMQDLGNGYQPIAFESRVLKPAEQNYNTTERELLGIVACTKVWRHYLMGSHYRIQSDHKPLEAFFNPKQELTRRQARWLEHLVEVGAHEIEHVPGLSIPVPDAFSRRPDHQKTSTMEGLREQFANADFKSLIRRTTQCAYLNTQDVENDRIELIRRLCSVGADPIGEVVQLNATTRQQGNQEPAIASSNIPTFCLVVQGNCPGPNNDDRATNVLRLQDK